MTADRDFETLGLQFASWAERLTADVGIPSGAAQRLASTIAGEVAALTPQVRLTLREAQAVRLSDRVDELSAFQRSLASLDGFGASPQSYGLRSSSRTSLLRVPRQLLLSRA